MEIVTMTEQPTHPRAATRRGFWTRGPGIAVVIVVVGLLAIGIYLLTNRSSSAADRAQVTVRSCEVGAAGAAQTAKVALTLRNTGDGAEYFKVTVEYRDAAGSRLDASTVEFPLAGPGGTVVASGSTFLGEKVQSGTCVVTGVSD